MGSYSGYRGQSVGRILHCLDTYCDTYHRLHENACVGDGEITYHGKVIAVFQWPEDKNDDVPTINFTGGDSDIDWKLIANFNKRQYFLKPFLDEMMPQSAQYLVQEISKVISLEDALAIKFIRDKWEGNWEQVSWQGRDKAERKIKKVLCKCCSPYWKEDKIDKYWKHLAMCAIYDIGRSCI